MRETKPNADICSCIIVKVIEIVSSILSQFSNCCIEGNAPAAISEPQ